MVFLGRLPREETGAVIVQIRVQVISVKLVNLIRKVLGNVGVTQYLSHH